MTYDPGYCGLAPLETGPNDPWWKRACKPHDEAHNALKAGLLEGSYMRPFGRFLLDIGKGMLQGAFLVVSGPVYAIVGGVGGLFLAGQEERDINRPKPWMPPHEDEDV